MPIGDFGQIVNIHKTLAECMKTWKSNLEETKQHYLDWWNHKGIVLNMWEHFQEGVEPHAGVATPLPPVDLNQKWFDPEWRAGYLDWYVAHSSLMADILPVANTQLGPGSLAAILGGVFEGGEDTIWIHPDPDFKEDIVFNSEHPNWILHKELLKACKKKAAGHYYVGMPDLMEGLDVLARVIALNSNLKVSNMIIVIDSTVVMLGLLVFQDWAVPLYSWFAIFVFGKVVEMFQTENPNRAVFIVSQKTQEVKELIVGKMGMRGTFLHGRGMYEGKEKEIIFTIAERKDLPRLKDEVKEIDPNAFISTMHASKDSPRPGM